MGGQVVVVDDQQPVAQAQAIAETEQNSGQEEERQRGGLATEGDDEETGSCTQDPDDPGARTPGPAAPCSLDRQARSEPDSGRDPWQEHPGLEVLGDPRG